MSEIKQKDFLPVTLDTLSLVGFAPCNLYIKHAENDYVLYVSEGTRFTSQDKENLISNGTTRLHISVEDDQAYIDHSAKSLSRIVSDDSLEINVKAKAVHTTCVDTMLHAFNDPRAPFLTSAPDIIAPTVDFILNDSQAMLSFVTLSSYDHCTFTHSTNVGIFGTALAAAFFKGIPLEELNEVAFGFFFHDLGKLKVPHDILTGEKPLTDAERKVIEKHPADGKQLLLDAEIDNKTAETIIIQHHEKDDGSGYPFGLSEDEIHPYAKICRVADIYEALTAKRSYKPKMPTFEALKIMKSEIKTDLDREIFKAFVGLFH